MTAAHCNDWCGPGSHHMPPCPAAPSEPPADLSDWERERQDTARFLPPAEAQQDDERERIAAVIGQHLPSYGGADSINCTGPDCRYVEWEPWHVAGEVIAARPSADRDALRGLADRWSSLCVGVPARGSYDNGLYVGLLQAARELRATLRAADEKAAS